MRQVALGAVSLTPTEHQAAQEHSDSYVLALVEHMDSVSPRLIARAEWLRAVDGNA